MKIFKTKPSVNPFIEFKTTPVYEQWVPPWRSRPEARNPQAEARLDHKLASSIKRIFESEEHIPPMRYSQTHLMPGIRYLGNQTGQCPHDPSTPISYPVHVDFFDTDVDRGSVCGALSIYDLTIHYPILSTFFDAEVIGVGGASFVTRKWETTWAIDLQHWSRFPHWTDDLIRDRHGHLITPLESPNEKHRHNNQGSDGDLAMAGDYFNLRDPGYDYDYRETGDIYMRWKEQYLMPKHDNPELVGASYEGFYYVWLDTKRGHIEGYYFHRSAGAGIQKLTLDEHNYRVIGTFAYR